MAEDSFCRMDSFKCGEEHAQNAAQTILINLICIMSRY